MNKPRDPERDARGIRAIKAFEAAVQAQDYKKARKIAERYGLTYLVRTLPKEQT